MKTIHPKTAIEAFKAQSPSVAKIRSVNGEVFTQAFLSLMLCDLVESFNVGKTMNDMQIVFAVETIQREYWYLKPDELKFIFTNAKTGKYGTTYDRIDCQIICDWIEKYVVERTQIAIDENIEKNKQHRLSEINYDLLKTIKKVIEPSKDEPKQKTVEVKRERTEAEIICNDILKEFDEIHKQQVPANSKRAKEQLRTIEYSGKHYTQDKFLEIRLEEMNKI